jgi:Domain of unknown function (DUF4279)
MAVALENQRAKILIFSDLLRYFMLIEKNYELEFDVAFESEKISTDELERILQLIPDKVVKKGIPRKINAAVPKTNILFVGSGVEKINSNVTDQINGLKIRLGDYKRFSSLSDEISIFISCTVYAYKFTPDLSLSPKQIRFISDLGSGYGVTVYDFSNLNSEDQ